MLDAWFIFCDVMAMTCLLSYDVIFRNIYIYRAAYIVPIGNRDVFTPKKRHYFTSFLETTRVTARMQHGVNPGAHTGASPVHM